MMLARSVQERLFWAAAPVLLFIAWMLGINYGGNTTSAPSEAQYYAATVFMAIAVVQVGVPDKFVLSPRTNLLSWQVASPDVDAPPWRRADDALMQIPSGTTHVQHQSPLYLCRGLRPRRPTTPRSSRSTTARCATGEHARLMSASPGSAH